MDRVNGTGVRRLCLRVPLVVTTHLRLNGSCRTSLDINPCTTVNITNGASNRACSCDDDDVRKKCRFGVSAFNDVMSKGVNGGHFSTNVTLKLAFRCEEFVVNTRARIKLMGIGRRVGRVVNRSRRKKCFPGGFTTFFALKCQF